MTPAARTLASLAPLALGIAGLVGAGASAAHVAPADLPLWRLLAMQLCWIGLATAAAQALGGPVRERLGLRRGRLGLAPLALGVLGLLALSGALEFAIAAEGLRDQGALGRLDAMVEAARPQSPWLAFLATAIAPGVGEEILFRGLLQRGLAVRLGAWAIPLAAAAFGLLHQDPVHTPAAFVMGCYLGAIAFLSGSTWAAVLCHVANNTAASLQQLLALPLPAPGAPAEAWLWGAASIACLALLLHSSCRRDSTVEHPSG